MDDGALLARTFPIILSGPSGAGKTTIRDALLEEEGGERLLFSVSMTTREPRPREREGIDYRFVDRAAFEGLIEAGAMLEHAEVHDEFYGTPRDNLEAARERGVHLLLDIDVQGARQVRAAASDALSIFILPPDGRRIVERLKRRGSETPAQRERRVATARAELRAVGEFDYVVVNDVLSDAVSRVRAVVHAAEAARPRLGERALRLAERIRAELDRG